MGEDPALPWTFASYPDRVNVDFNPNPTRSLGVEMELILVDQLTGDLVDAGGEIIDELAAIGLGDRAKHELFECTIEIITGVASNVAEATEDLRQTLDELFNACDRRGLDPLCIGTHPYASWRNHRVSPDPRYGELLKAMRWPARRLLIFGVHVHVGVSSKDKVIPITNALTEALPVLLALSASSPMWNGTDTGMASARTKVFEGLPTAGLPPFLNDWAEFERFLGALMTARAIKTIREVWWDIRPHPEFGTVELRMCDGINTLREVGAVAALAQCLVERMERQLDEGQRLTIPANWTVRENKWRASRYGLDAHLITDADGTCEPLRAVALSLVDSLTPISRDLACETELLSVRHIIENGNGADRQRRIRSEGGSAEDVVHAIAAEMRTNRTTRV